MAFRKITDVDVKGKGNVGRPDTPGVSTAEMQRIMDEIPREVIIPAFNALIDALADKTSAATLGITAPVGIAGSTVQEVVNALLVYVNAHKNDKENPHAVTAAQVDAYTKKQTDDAISKKVVEIGVGDMTQAVYDPTGQRKDIFAAAMMRETYDPTGQRKDIFAAAMMRATYDPQGRQTDIFKAIDKVSNIYYARLTLNGWTACSSADQAKGLLYQQTATLTCANSHAPVVTAASEFLSGIGYDKTGVPATDDVLNEVQDIINDGVTVTAYNSVLVKVKEKPTAEIRARWVIQS